MLNLTAPPSPLPPWQRRTVVVTALLVALTRLLALSRSMWDWDEAQFALALREYDVLPHHPHPPGFPLFILAAQLARLVTATDFGALRLVTLIAACALFPLAVALARELRFGFATVYGGALLFVFLPNVWFYGGTAFSDIPGLAMILAAVTMLLRGCRSERSFVAGAILLGLAAGFRPQSLLFGTAPFLVAAYLRGFSAWRRTIATGFLIVFIVAAGYFGAAVASSSFEGYRLAVRSVGEWVRTHDAFTAPWRPSLHTLFDEYFLEPMGGRWLPVLISLLAAAGMAAGLIRRHIGVVLVTATFLPFVFFAWLMLDVFSIHRYATSYVFLHAILAAELVALVTRPLGRVALPAALALLVLLAGASARSTWPALAEVRSTDSPTWSAVTWLRERVPAGGRIWAHGSMRPFVEYALADRDVRIIDGIHAIPFEGTSSDFYVAEGRTGGGAATRFERAHGRIWSLARQRFFETSVVRVSSMFELGEGWGGEESEPGRTWRWMGARSVAKLWPAPPRGRLRIELAAQERVAPTVEVWFNGALVERVAVTPSPTAFEWLLPSRSDAPNELVLVADRTVNLARLGVSNDARDLSVRLDSFSWEPVP